MSSTRHLHKYANYSEILQNQGMLPILFRVSEVFLSSSVLHFQKIVKFGWNFYILAIISFVISGGDKPPLTLSLTWIRHGTFFFLCSQRA